MIFVKFLKECKKLGFKSIWINTNMSLIHKKMEILDYVTNLVASLDMLEEKRYSKILWISINTIKKVKQNIIKCAKLQKKKNFQMTINCVVIPETINNAYKVMKFSFQNKINFAIVPAEFCGGEINMDLKNNTNYKQLIKDILKEKKKNKLIFGSQKYLETIQNFNKFDCYPNLIPHIYPNGDLLYPCEPLQNHRINLLEIGSYKKVMEKCIKEYGKLPKCKNKCHKACYIDLLQTL